MASRNIDLHNGKRPTPAPSDATPVMNPRQPRRKSKPLGSKKRPRRQLPVTLVSTAAAVLVGVSILPTLWPVYQMVSTGVESTVSRHPIRTLKGHSSWVYAIASSPDGKTLVSGSYDGQIMIWDVPSGELRQKLNAHADAVEALAITPDGRFLVSGSWDNRVKVWNLNTLEILHTFEGHRDDVKAVSISADGQWVASGGTDSTVRVWGLETGYERLTWHRSAWVKALAFSPDSEHLIIGSYDGSIVAQSLHASSSAETWADHGEAVWAVAFSPDGQRLASGSADGVIKLWHMADGAMHKTFAAHDETVSSLGWSPDGHYLVSSSTDGSIKVWNADTGEIMNHWMGHHKPIWALAVCPAEWTIATGSSEPTIKLWSPFGDRFGAGGSTHYESTVF